MRYISDDDLYAAPAVPTPCDGVGPTHRQSDIESYDRAESFTALCLLQHVEERPASVTVYRLAAMTDEANDYAER